MAFSIPGLATGPSVRVGPSLVRAQTSWPVRALSLWSYCRTVDVDSRTRTVRATTRWLWGLLAARTVPFDDVRHVTYGMHDASAGAVSYVTFEREGGESFMVGLRLKDGSHVDLLRFSGDGELVVEDSLFWEALEDKVRELTDVSGTQQEDSLSFIDVLCERLGVPLGG